MVIGEHAVELVLHRSGRIRALVRRGTGMLVLDRRLKLEVVANGRANARPRAALAWSSSAACFAGEVESGEELVPGPVDVMLEIGGNASRVTLAEVAIVVDPVIGGSVMVAGNHSVEFVAGVDGDLEAVLRDAAGTAVEGNANVTLAAKVATRLAEGGATARAVALEWDGARTRFAGRVARHAELVRGPVELTVNANGKVTVGGLGALGLRAKAAHGGRVVVTGDYSVELIGGSGSEVQAFVFDEHAQADDTGSFRLSLGVGVGADSRLFWDPPSLSYRGRLETHTVPPMQPVRVTLVAEGRTYAGGVLGLDGVSRSSVARGFTHALAPRLNSH